MTMVGRKSQHAAHARKDAVNNKAVHNRVDAVDRQCVVGQVGERVNAQCQQVGQARADDTERQPEYQRHNADKAGQGGVFAGQDAVNGHTALVLAAFAGRTTVLSQRRSIKLNRISASAPRGPGPSHFPARQSCDRAARSRSHRGPARISISVSPSTSFVAAKRSGSPVRAA